MELLFTKNPIVQELHAKCIDDCLTKYVETATHLNIATGFVSNESIVELKRLVEYRKRTLHLSLFIGMNYIDGFTKLQYDAVRELDFHLSKNGIGNVFVSTKAMFHGKMYSFLDGSHCLGAFVGSSNLGSFVGTTRNYIEADVFFEAEEGACINEHILKVTSVLGEPIATANEILEFKEPDAALLDGYDHVRKIKKTDLHKYLSKATSNIVKIPLKTMPKSNLNTYFGAGKVKGRFSRRDYYEVEIIIDQDVPNRDLLPDKNAGNFMVITEDGYMFECARQGDNSKNFRSAYDLKILGRWIKGQMENEGALKLGDLVTEDTIKKFGKSKLVLTQSEDKKFWILSLE